MASARRIGLTKNNGPRVSLHAGARDKRSQPSPELKSAQNSSTSDSESSLSELSGVSTPENYRSQSPASFTAPPKSDSESSDDSKDLDCVRDKEKEWKESRKRRGIDRDSSLGTSSDESTSKKKPKISRESFRVPIEIDDFIPPQRKTSIKYGRKSYGKSNNVHGTAKAETPKKAKAGTGFKVPPNVTPMSPRNGFRQPVGGDDEDKKKAKKEAPAFKMPPEEPSSSMQTAATDGSDAVFDQPTRSRSKSSSPASSPPMDLTPEPNDEKPALCPMCEKPVDRQLLKDFQLSKRTQVRDQHRFCNEHQKRDAQDEWKQCEYPEIDWEALESRCKQFYSDLEKIVTGKKDSHFQDMLKEARDDGNTSLKQYLRTGSLAMIPTGYYGARGSRLMIEALSPHFHPFIREFVSSASKSTKSRTSSPTGTESSSGSNSASPEQKATQARLIKAAGSQAFIQVVLVPELCMRLICQDMRLEPRKSKKGKGKGKGKGKPDGDVGLAKARTIMFESEKLGNILHQEEGDKLKPKESQEDEEMGWDVDD